MIKLPNQDFWKTKRVLVTGHTGFKGTWFCKWLISLGAKVSGVSLADDSSTKLFNETSLVDELDGHFECDLSNLEHVTEAIQEARPEIIFHLAAQPLVSVGYQKPVLTWKTNLLGTINLMEAVRTSSKEHCTMVIITTDKVYAPDNKNYSYRETDQLGGLDPYSASKSAVEIAVNCWKHSYFSTSASSNIKIATARAGNVIGGGDWAENRIVPDLIRSIQSKRILTIRNPNSIRPWQHVLEPLSGYLILAEELHQSHRNRFDKTDGQLISFNFGPSFSSQQTVLSLIEKVNDYWECEYTYSKDEPKFKESERLTLSSDKAFTVLGWSPRWDFIESVQKTIGWYKSFYNGEEADKLINSDIDSYLEG